MGIGNLDFLKDLNDIQNKAVTTINGPVMIIAGPGSGKTRVLTYRIAYLIDQGIDPFNILALTFTNKSAREMKERIGSLIGSEARNIWAGTFHSIFARILRIEAEKLNYPSNFTIYDSDDSKSVLKAIIKQKGLNDKIYKPNQVLYRISLAKNNLISPKNYKAHAELVAEDRQTGRPLIAEIYAAYALKCFKSGAMDFDDLLYKTLELLVRFPDVLHKYQHKFKYVMVDEFQDTNLVQYQIVRKLAAAFENLCVVGDDAQSIYGFRGASIENILNIEKDYSDLQAFKLEQNYRSTPHIVSAANHLIKNNREQLEKTIWTEKSSGEKIKVVKSATDNEEGRRIADMIMDAQQRNHYKNSDFCILYRTNAQSRAFEEALRKYNLPYKIFGGTSFYQRKEIKDLIAYLRLTINPNDDEALKRVINYPRRGIGKTTIDKVIVVANAKGVPIWEIVKSPNAYEFKGRAADLMKQFTLMIQRFSVEAQDKDAFEVASVVVKESRLLGELFSDKTVEGVARYENLQELLSGIKEFTTNDEVIGDEEIADKKLGSYLQNIALLTNADDEKEDPNKISLMSIHSSKGLEFKSVFIVGLEDGLFPSFMSLDTREDLEEERRLFYVAVTRAEIALTLSFATSRYRFGKLNYCEASRFLEEIEEKDLDILTPIRSRKTVDVDDVFNDIRKGSPVRRKTAPAKVDMSKYDSDSFVKIDDSLLEIGSQVVHQRFGKGSVVKLEGSEGNKKATIDFDAAGSKQIMIKFAKLLLL